MPRAYSQADAILEHLQQTRENIYALTGNLKQVGRLLACYYIIYTFIRLSSSPLTLTPSKRAPTKKRGVFTNFRPGSQSSSNVYVHRFYTTHTYTNCAPERCCSPSKAVLTPDASTTAHKACPNSKTNFSSHHTCCVLLVKS